MNNVTHKAISLEVFGLVLLWFNVTVSVISVTVYSDGTVVQFQNLDLLPDTQRNGQLGVFSVLRPTRALGRPKTSLTSLPLEGHHAVRVCQESNPDLLICSPARYLYATGAGLWRCKSTSFLSLEVYMCVL